MPRVAEPRRRNARRGRSRRDATHALARSTRLGSSTSHRRSSSARVPSRATGVPSSAVKL